MLQMVKEIKKKSLFLFLVFVSLGYLDEIKQLIYIFNYIFNYNVSKVLVYQRFAELPTFRITMISYCNSLYLS